MNLRTFNKLIAPFKRQVRQMITRGLVRLIDTNQLATVLQVTGRNGEVLSGVEYMEPYGYTAHPHPVAEAILLSGNGRGDSSVAIVVANRQYRLQGLAQGEVALYDDLGQKVHLTRNGIVITSDNGLTINADTTINGTLNTTGSISSDGDVSDSAGSMSGMRGTYNGHGHPALNTPPSEQM